MDTNKKEPEDKFHDKQNKISLKLSKSLKENIKNVDILFENCSDIVARKIPIGKEHPLDIYILYIDGMAKRETIEFSIIEKILFKENEALEAVGNRKISLTQLLLDNVGGTVDIAEADSFDDLIFAVLGGDTAIFIDGSLKGLIVATKGFDGRGVQTPDNEAVIRGSKDALTESLRTNTALIRRRIRDTKLKIEPVCYGLRSRTDMVLVYMDDIVQDGLIDQIKTRLSQYEIDAILDSGYIEQLIEDDWLSPFPQIQSTQRPDKVASAVLEGRAAIIVDNSPFALIVPGTFNSFFQASEDYYQRWAIMSFTRLLRYMVSFFALALPGLYIALLNFHPTMIPTTLAVSLAAAREGIAFPTVVEIIIIELEFELLREAGVRLPTAIGHTIGIVGGLIVGQAAVSAKLISPMVVIIVAITAIASFAVPDYGLTTAFRLLKYFVIILSATLGLYGFLISLLLIMTHLVTLKSFNIPYLSPYVAGELNDYNDWKDALIRMPLFMQKERPVFAKTKQKVRLRTYNHKRKNQD
ncbi:MAG TPA: spore germination protein [Epulopiscium sp.]|nr:spore germination protein [Candidatus Epulonipiscium sp.]